MFDISLTELLLVTVLAVIFIGPKEFPVVVKAVARLFYHLKHLWHEIKQAMNEVAKESGVEDIKRELEDEYQRDIQMIQGDDGNYYPAYDIDKLADDKMMSDKPKYEFPMKDNENE